MTSIDDPIWRDNPRLNGWLQAGHGGFPAWTELVGGEWDFTTGSLPRLEQAVRDRYPDWDRAYEARDEAFLTVAAWYLGEVHVRNYGALWHCSPDPAPYGGGRVEPLLTLPREVLDEEEEADLAAAQELCEDDFPFCLPVDAVVGAADREKGGWLAESVESYAYWESVVERALALARTRPGQSPGSRIRPDAPGPLDPGRPGQDLAHWLVVREDAFPLWARALGREAELDFTERSLELLEEVLRERVRAIGLGRRPDVLEAHGPAMPPDAFQLFDDPVFDCALWYLGETVCRARGARWLPLRANLDVTPATLPQLAVARIGHRIGPRLELTAAVGRCLRDRSSGRHAHPTDTYRSLPESASAVG
ncbi:hypothetical protein [Streptomyces sp. TLI_171]|uniref:hypothetical protein n=1 Tax=Streptomyces sp. TLI_171 TaxID=1938859 RepID=UPI000C1A42E6|nr:hypothetical protein [Streptomyces sp. TLI_171]RKE05094.1 hypothetical protein BX266_7350 [Streptomyces sp. TLI_171]